MKKIKGIFILIFLLSSSLLWSQGGNDPNANANPNANDSKDKSAEEQTEAFKPEIQPEKSPEYNAHEKLWKNADYKAYHKAFEELQKLSLAFANNRYRLALASYQSGMNTLFKMEERVATFKKEQAEKKRLDEKWYWQKVDRKSAEDRWVGREKQAAKQKAISYFTKAINYLDEIKNPDLRERPEFKRLLSYVFRSWIMAEYDTQNFPQCIPILELYLEIDKNELEYPAHKYLANCYAFEENALRKAGGPEDQINRLKNKKNTHLLRATELKYGKETVEYREMVKMVNRDEVVSITP